MDGRGGCLKGKEEKAVSNIAGTRSMLAKTNPSMPGRPPLFVQSVVIGSPRALALAMQAGGKTIPILGPEMTRDGRKPGLRRTG